jgi:hypothetical protein
MKEQKKTKMLTHKQMVSKMLKKPTVKAAVKELDRTEFAILDEILAARKSGWTNASSNR